MASQVANVAHPDHPAFQDFGDVMVRGNGGTGYIRVDWFTPAGLPTWGDTRLTIVGTNGYIEVRKNVDIGGREGGNHLFLVDAKGVQYIDCSKVELTVRPSARRRRAQSHRDRDDAGALLPRDGARAACAEAGADGDYNGAPRYDANLSRSANAPAAVTSRPAPGPCTTSGFSRYRLVRKSTMLSVS